MSFRGEAMAVRFGTSGVRGLVEELSREVCHAYVRAFVRHIVAPDVPVLLGMDLRPSSPQIARFCFEALVAEGREAIFCGVLPTPALAFFAQERGMAAIMVTGSHIPFDRNGIKFYTPQGEITKAHESSMTKALEPGEADVSLPLPEPRRDALELYRQRAVDAFGAGSLSGWRVGLYEHSSASRDVLRRILEDCGATVIAFGRSDAFVPLDTEALSPEDHALARQAVAEHELHALISTDGDGDRPMLADETGVWWRGDFLGLAVVAALGVACVATPVSCTTAIERSGLCSQVVRTRIGSPYVVAAMEGLRATCPGPVAGFEANGGFMLASDLVLDGRPVRRLPTRDAALPILAVLCSAARQGVRLSVLREALPQRPTASQRLTDFPTARSRELLRLVDADAALRQRICAAAQGELSHVDRTDGLRLIFASGEIIHLRPSGNAPELRCYSEAATSDRAEALVAGTLAAVARWADG
ncbi:MAG: phosphomannomutase [Desulfomicrobiaceae bacterium]|nr:phosphoglucomutase/phosphomannomutase alpha/beta/alpha domain [Desulfomicrobiaceae bacterium]MDI3492618.1 phosphomannomutase [Desulfomicrobiaceae bacterium]MDK2873675.1 phosphomannomutase [Desulfomicrobiaceae bacterium]HCF06050.1 phosphomannomutase [Desulfomicrobiaceae bacterium]